MIYLASQSPRRHELLNQIGVAHTRVEVSVDETPYPAESPEAFVRRMALTKARAGLALHPDGLVLGSDTAVVLDERILGKPDHREHALEMLRALSGREHRVLTGVALVSDRGENYRLSDSRVLFRPLGDQELTAYWETGEPIDKAGAYAVQGLGALFIERLEGSYSGVMGLPLFETGELLSTAGLPALKPVTLTP